MTTATEASPADAVKAFSVADIVGRIRALIEREFASPVWVEGQVSNCTYHGSGHIYFSLKDEQTTDRFGQPLVLPCAFFKGVNQHLKFKLTDGLKVLCFGRVTTYEGRSQYQLQVLRVEPKGIGALQLAFDQLKKRLAAEGLFDEARKRPIPALPQRVGVITSLTGSAVHDMVSKLRGHFHVVIVPAKVQGEGAALEIAAALDLANAHRVADVLIVGRGGGSVEDLWAFNEEPVARAIGRSKLPVISAVGHQDDWTIADYVADLRASTPTDAAKRLVEARQQILDQFQDLASRLEEAVGASLEQDARALDALRDRLRSLHPAQHVAECERRARDAQTRLTQEMRHSLDLDERLIQVLVGRLQALSPLAVLARGYSITFALPACPPEAGAGRPGRHVVTDASRVKPGQWLETQVAQGRIVSLVRETAATAPDGRDDDH